MEKGERLILVQAWVKAGLSGSRTVDRLFEDDGGKAKADADRPWRVSKGCVPACCTCSLDARRSRCYDC